MVRSMSLQDAESFEGFRAGVAARSGRDIGGVHLSSMPHIFVHVPGQQLPMALVTPSSHYLMLLFIQEWFRWSAPKEFDVCYIKVEVHGGTRS